MSVEHLYPPSRVFTQDLRATHPNSNCSREFLSANTDRNSPTAQQKKLCQRVINKLKGWLNRFFNYLWYILCSSSWTFYILFLLLNRSYHSYLFLMHLVGIFQPSKYKDAVSYVDRRWELCEQLQVSPELEKRGRYYQSLAIDRFDHRILEAVPYNGASKTNGKQAKKFLGNQQLAQSTSGHVTIFNRWIFRTPILVLKTSLATLESILYFRPIQRRILEDRGRRRWGRTVEATMVVRVQSLLQKTDISHDCCAKVD